LTEFEVINFGRAYPCRGTYFTGSWTPRQTGLSVEERGKERGGKNIVQEINKVVGGASLGPGGEKTQQLDE